MLSKVENIFVRQAKNVVFIFTFIAFLITGGMGVYIGILFSSSPDKPNITQSSSLDDYQEQLRLKHDAKYQKKEVPNSKAEQKRDQFHPELVSAIIANINKFASVVGEDPVDKNKFKRVIKSDLERVLGLKGLAEQKEVLEELQRETKKLEAIGEAQHELPVTDVRRIYTREFYEWFIRDKEKDIEDAELKVSNEEERVAENKEEANSLVQVLGFIAIVFVAFLAFLIYMRIDLGLRLVCKTIADNPGNPLTGNIQATSENADGDISDKS